jgi:predicted aconitase with swiveling domain
MRRRRDKRQVGGDESVRTITIRGRGAIPGEAEGEAVVCPDSIAGNSGALGDTDGVIYERGNVNYGVSIKGKILVVPCAKGSNGFSAHFKGALIAGVRPAGWISTRVDARLGVAVASMNIPSVVDFRDADPLDVIENGDWVRINGDTGEVVIMKKD